MNDLKYIRNNFDLFKKNIIERNVKIDLSNILTLDEKKRKLIEKKDNLIQEKKKISKSKDQSQFSKSKKLTEDINKVETELLETDKNLMQILISLPNIAQDDVPVGANESFNKEILKFNEPPNFKFKPLSHFELGEKLDMMDFTLATKTTGARFVFLKSDLAALERAIINLMLSIHTNEFGYNEVSPPLMANESSMFGTGQLPKFEKDQFEVKLDDENSRKFLIPTAEVILTNMVKDSILNLNDLPLRLVAATPCFRKEAGSYGKDTKGMIRQHQFYKVELVSIVKPNECLKELERMTSCAEKILKVLNLPYRKILLSTGDMGFSAEKTFDLEVWIPSENKYREISSCSSCGQFQARRLKARFKDENKKINFVGTLNGSGLAVGRTLVAILENYQNESGEIIVPDVLIPFMNKKKIIKFS
ncbi:MAG: serine--tRNA ligase [Candidatus Pelagibacter sp. TMED64]|nr:serine--tRNA ligase [Candidatus Pelagibacter sp.]OUU66071.1 MAG: serine--tRNA ligase [Candidatus Pelagibacter sp. TMED64]|tara:strand:- start:6476 stop:7735 length:1260 start_codon:yes stop_codon:yes gene_type:complete